MLGSQGENRCPFFMVLHAHARVCVCVCMCMCVFAVFLSPQCFSFFYCEKKRVLKSCVPRLSSSIINLTPFLRNSSHATFIKLNAKKHKQNNTTPFAFMKDTHFRPVFRRCLKPHLWHSRTPPSRLVLSCSVLAFYATVSSSR